ncbi:MAG: uracil-DNA glycosylase family protein [archaeon]
MVQGVKNLDQLWGYVHDLNKKHFPGNDLMPVLGGGMVTNPKVMFVFINPTHLNISSGRGWDGPRFPFIGTKPVWRVFHRAGMFDDRLIDRINASKSWSLEFTGDVLDFLKSKSFYLTNVVKWTGHDSTLPDSKKIKLFLPVLEKEIEIVQPKYIVTFGLIPFENIAKQKIKLDDYYSGVMKNQKLSFFEVQFGDFKTKVIPCYFPVGRGNPKRAVEILKLVNASV